MATDIKDFKVKNGLQVALDGIFGGTVSVATPISDQHAATKAYVDSLAGSSVSVGEVSPEFPNLGDLWLNTQNDRVSIYLTSGWSLLSYYSDPVKDHVHNTSIGGNGLITAQFISSGGPQDEVYFFVADGQFPETTDWENSLNGGIIA